MILGMAKNTRMTPPVNHAIVITREKTKVDARCNHRDDLPYFEDCKCDWSCL